MKASAFPRYIILPDGRQIVVTNELCNCTHFRTQHDGDFGYAHCKIPSCQCSRFVWKCVVLGGVSDVDDKWAASIGPLMWEIPIHEVLEALNAANRSINYYQDELDELQALKADLEKHLNAAEASEKKLSKKVAYVSEWANNLSKEIADLYERLGSLLQHHTRIVVGRAKSILVDDSDTPPGLKPGG